MLSILQRINGMMCARNFEFNKAILQQDVKFPSQLPSNRKLTKDDAKMLMKSSLNDGMENVSDSHDASRSRASTASTT